MSFYNIESGERIFEEGEQIETPTKTVFPPPAPETMPDERRFQEFLRRPACPQSEVPHFFRRSSVQHS